MRLWHLCQEKRSGTLQAFPSWGIWGFHAGFAGDVCRVWGGLAHTENVDRKSVGAHITACFWAQGLANYWCNNGYILKLNAITILYVIICLFNNIILGLSVDCLRFHFDKRGFFPATIALCLLKGVQALGSVKRFDGMLIINVNTSLLLHCMQ